MPVGDSGRTDKTPIVVYRKGELTKRRGMRDWPWHVYTPMPATGFGIMLDSMHAFCSATNRPDEDGIRSGHRIVSTYGPGKPDGCLWCFRREEDAAAFRVWCVENQIVVGDKPL
jgi:hypothetical protein